VRLAEAAAQTGELVRLQVQLADGSMARRFICPSKASLGDDLEWSGLTASA